LRIYVCNRIVRVSIYSFNRDVRALFYYLINVSKRINYRITFVFNIEVLSTLSV